MSPFVYGLADNALARLRTLWAWSHWRGARLERGVLVKGDAHRLVLGNGVVIQSGTVLHTGGKAWCRHEGRIEIGEGSTISPHCVLYGGGPGGIRIGRRFDCGPFVGIYASRTDYRTRGEHIFAPVQIGDDVIAFSHVVISPGVCIGDGAVIAAGSVVLRDVPAGAFVAGAPARVIGSAGGTIRDG